MRVGTLAVGCLLGVGLGLWIPSRNSVGLGLRLGLPTLLPFGLGLGLGLRSLSGWASTSVWTRQGVHLPIANFMNKKVHDKKVTT